MQAVDHNSHDSPLAPNVCKDCRLTAELTLTGLRWFS